MDDVAQVQCPYCFEWVELWVDPDTAGSFVEDCSVCCRPWQVSAARDADGALLVTVARAT
ncbi:MAG TPA: CPXCG motif-containing cysteine-rich protein [Kofleriaceae bacterium]|nr:CPXCG motif-containing cysteine-rich protein [Kofleriaceae bacterium]